MSTNYLSVVYLLVIKYSLLGSLVKQSHSSFVYSDSFDSSSVNSPIFLVISALLLNKGKSHFIKYSI